MLLKEGDGARDAVRQIRVSTKLSIYERDVNVSNKDGPSMFKLEWTLKFEHQFEQDAQVEGQT